MSKSKPTIEELEAILNSGEEVPIEILPNGEIRTRPTERERAEKAEAERDALAAEVERLKAVLQRDGRGRGSLEGRAGPEGGGEDPQSQVQGSSEMKYRKKPVVIEAVQVKEILRAARKEWSALPVWMVEAYDRGDILFTDGGVSINTLEGSMIGRIDDWIICGVKGELYPCRDDIFKQTYDPVD